MKTIVEALKDLYVALGGKAEDVANLVLNPDLIEKIAEVVPSGSGLTLYGPYEAIGSYQTVASGGFYEDYAITDIISRDPVYDIGENVTLPDGDTPGKCLLVSFATANDFMVTDIKLPTYSPPEDPYPGEWTLPGLLCENMISSDNTMTPSIFFLSTVRLPIAENSES